MRKLIPILVLAVVLAGCQGETPQSPQLTGRPTVNPTATIPPIASTSTPISTLAATGTPVTKISVKAEELRGIQVQFWYPWSGAMAKEVDAVVNDFNQSNIWGITVKAVSQGSILGLDDLVTHSLQGGSLPQVIALPAEYIASYQDAGAAEVELDPYLQDPQWGLSNLEEADFFPSFWNESAGSGPRLSLPVMRSMAVLFYNQTWAKALGFDRIPATPTDFRTQVCKASKANAATGDPDMIWTGGWIVNTASPTVYSWLAAYGAVPDQSPAATGPQVYDNLNTATAFAYLRKLSDDNCAWVSRNPEPFNYFVAHQALVFSGTLEDLLAQSAAMTYAKSSEQWTIIPYPADGGQNPLITFGPSLAIFKSTPAKQLASWLFMRWMVLPRIQAELAASGSLLPVRKSALDLMSNYAKNNPQWSQAAGWLSGKTQALPGQSWWKITQRVLEDASGQVFQPFLTADKIPDVLKELDATVQELLNRKQ